MAREQSEQEKDIRKDVKKYTALKAVAESEGGQILIDNLKDDVVDSIEWLGANFKTALDIELRSQIARMNERLALYRTLTRAETNQKDARQVLKDLLKEQSEDL